MSKRSDRLVSLMPGCLVHMVKLAMVGLVQNTWTIYLDVYIGSLFHGLISDVQW